MAVNIEQMIRVTGAIEVMKHAMSKEEYAKAIPRLISEDELTTALLRSLVESVNITDEVYDELVVSAINTIKQYAGGE